MVDEAKNSAVGHRIDGVEHQIPNRTMQLSFIRLQNKLALGEIHFGGDFRIAAQLRRARRKVSSLRAPRRSNPPGQIGRRHFGEIAELADDSLEVPHFIEQCARALLKYFFKFLRRSRSRLPQIFDRNLQWK